MSIKNAIGVNTDNPLTEEVQKWIATDRTNQLKYIGLISHQNGGKDYVASYLQKTLERKVEVVKFATKLVEITAAIIGVDDLSLFQDRTWKDQPHFIWQSNITSNKCKLITPREALCTVGSLMRSVDSDIWVRVLANSYTDPDTLYIISDLRYQNEMAYVQANNGIVVFIENLQAAQQQHRKEYKDGSWQPHSSEQLVWSMHYHDTQPDYVLVNNDYTNKQPLQDLLTFISML